MWVGLGATCLSIVIPVTIHNITRCNPCKECFGEELGEWKGAKSKEHSVEFGQNGCWCIKWWYESICWSITQYVIDRVWRPSLTKSLLVFFFGNIDSIFLLDLLIFLGGGSILSENVEDIILFLALIIGMNVS